jgi:ribosomal protein S12 methylthiotransferase
MKIFSQALQRERNMTENRSRFHLVGLGCPKNRVDAERILATMVAAGFSHTDRLSEAHVIIINTCSFIEPAVEESIDAILNARFNNPEAVLVVSGCLPLRYKDQLKKSLPEVNVFASPDQTPELPGLIKNHLLEDKFRKDYSCLSKPVFSDRRILSTVGYAYLKVSEGCSRRCRYCAIPSIRGPLRSAALLELERETENLVSMGAVEIILVAQDLTAYGRDQSDPKGLVKLLGRLEKIKGIEWIRLMYLHPSGITAELVRTIAESKIILPYLDIPFQHVSERVLKAMGRPWKGDRIRKLVDRLRKEIPELVLRTTMMTGFPAEGEEDFEELLQFVENYKIEHLGVFEYRREEGTPSHKLGDPVPRNIKKKRADKLRRINAKNSQRRNRERIGVTERAIIEGVAEESDLLLQGRTWDQAPDIDGVLYITEGSAGAGEIRPVRIHDSHGPDLFGAVE